MAIHIGDDITAISIGNDSIYEVYIGGELIWAAQSWDFVDDFERASIGSAWTGSGAVISEGALKKNNSTGNARYWTAQRFDTDDIDVEVVIGTTQDSVQLGEILIGSGVANDDYVRLLFSKNSLRADQWTGSFTTLGTFANQPLEDGAVIRLSRRGSLFTVTYNSQVMGTFTSSVARGAAYRRVALAVNMSNSFFINWFGPTFDKVSIRSN